MVNQIGKPIICVMKKLFFYSVLLLACIACSDSDEQTEAQNLGSSTLDNPDDNQSSDNSQDNYANIDFSNWKVTLPVDENNNGSPDEYQPSTLINGGYRTNASILPFMYDDVDDQSIVFYTYPEVSTTNSSYSRTELRELINPSNSKENWTLNEGGVMEGRLNLVDISEDNNSSNQYHKTIVMQIHGIISQSDMDTHVFTSNNGPPLIKIRWINGFIWSYKKSLVDTSTSGDDLLDVTSATWVDESTNMGYVGFEPFDFKITASSGKLELQLNNLTPLIYEDASLAKWPFENYFKAGNYLGTTDANAFSYVKYYQLNINH